MVKVNSGRLFCCSPFRVARNHRIEEDFQAFRKEATQTATPATPQLTAATSIYVEVIVLLCSQFRQSSNYLDPEERQKQRESARSVRSVRK